MQFAVSIRSRRILVELITRKLTSNDYPQTSIQVACELDKLEFTYIHQLTNVDFTIQNLHASRTLGQLTMFTFLNHTEEFML